jgi:hypothetical protein
MKVVDHPVDGFEPFSIPLVSPGFNFKDAGFRPISMNLQDVIRIDGFVKRPSSRRAKRVE